jgi:hypothetical protein|tara:strand:- start:676 stop:975 length:300 start_codon:yes stop_codon:yes gene_type:complete
MSTKILLKRWKNMKKIIKEENKADTLKLLLDIRNNLNIQLNTINFPDKFKMLKLVNNCDAICQYILFLEEHLNETIRILKLAQEGFDERNRIFGLDKYL